MTSKPIEMAEPLKDLPKNWGRWGADDEIGCLNFLTGAEVLRGVRAAKQGKVFMLGVPVARPEGDQTHPARSQPIHTLTHDEGAYISERDKPFPGGAQILGRRPDDVSPTDHAVRRARLSWYGDEIYNGYDSRTTLGGLQKCSIQVIGERGVVGRGILIDAARYKGKKHLDRGEGVRLDDLLAAGQESENAHRKARSYRAAHRLAKSVLRRRVKRHSSRRSVRRSGTRIQSGTGEMVPSDGNRLDQHGQHRVRAVCQQEVRCLRSFAWRVAAQFGPNVQRDRVVEASGR
jgi:hypothetical protein